jgi:hypothetical protein
MNIKCSELDNITVSFDYFNSIKSVGDEVVKYVRGFNQLTQEYMKKLQLFQTNFAKKLAKSDNPKITQITLLTSKITEIVSQIEELCQVSIDDIDSRAKKFETLLKEKTDYVNSLKKSPAELTKDLNSSYIEINKTKNNFINSISKTEELIDKYYMYQNKIQEHESGLKDKLPENEYNLLKENQKSQLNEMTNSIKMTKKYEEFHKGSIKASIKKHDKFVEECNSYRDSIKASACEIADEIKTLVCAFMLSLKNNYKQPLCSADIYLNEFNKLNEIEEMDKIITSSFKNDNQFKNFEAAKYQLKSFSRLKNTNYLKDEENNDNDKSNNNQNDNKRKIVEKLEDGFTVMSYICDESLIMTIKTLFENFNLIEKEGFDMKFEEAKNRTQKYILKIISNMNNYPFAKEGTYNENSEEKMQEYLEYKREELSNKEIIDLTELLDTHENRIIFLQKLSDYRARGKFVLCDKDYILLSQLFNILSEKIQKDADYRTAEMVIILSQTYFIEEGTKKIYIQDSFKGNKVFKDKSFWEEFLCYSINKEIMKTLNLDQKIQEDKENSDYKFSNVVFAQILTLIDNMFEFDLDCETIKDVLNPKISVYKLNDNFKETINDVILAKQEQKNLEMEQNNKEKKE